MSSKKLIHFSDLEPMKTYRLLFGKERDHGYSYQIRFGKVLGNKYLYNVTKQKDSSLCPDELRAHAFILETEKIKTYDSLEFKVEFTSRGLKVGCQGISKDDSLKLANDILGFYNEQ